MSKSNIRSSIAKNNIKVCSVQGCPKSRHGVSKYCNSHSHQYYHYGHPQASQVMLKDMEHEKKLAENIIGLNHESHAGIQYGINFLDKLLLECAQGISFVPHGDSLANLHSQGVTGKDILSTLSALYILRDSQQRLIKSDRHLTFLLGLSVLKMARQSSRSYGKHRRDIGKYLQEKLGILCLNISKAAQELVLKKDDTLIQMSKPLALS